MTDSADPEDELGAKPPSDSEQCPEVSKKRDSEQSSEAELYQARLLLSRTKLWTPNLQKLLRTWNDQISKRRDGHKYGEQKYNRIYYGLGIPISILNAIITTAILTTNFSGITAGNITASSSLASSLGTTFADFSNTTVPSSSMATNNWIVQLIGGIIGIAVTVLTALMTYLDAGGTRQKHKNASDTYQALSHQIDAILQMPATLRGDPVIIVQDIRNKFDGAAKDSPSIPSEFETSLKYKTTDHTKGVEIFIEFDPDTTRPEDMWAERTSLQDSLLRTIQNNED